ncbi:hypothetical protein [Bacillus xiapuensis]|uniref:Peptidase n=1 Tax=Bacillus xiapuensis TaxID=2014075 RepID=A0ABU6N9V6_9BACI|nr:hypothetical protein [Bacillus xiapuensis]
MSIMLRSILSLVPLEIRKDKKHYIVEDTDSREFYEMNKVSIEAIYLIQQSFQLSEIERQLKEKYPDEEVNILDFAEQLLDLNLIREIDGVKIETNPKKKESLGFLWISPKIGKFFFNTYAYFIYSLLFVINVILLGCYPSLFPHYKDLFVFNFMVFNIPLLAGLTILLVFIHEFGHILAMRANNLPTKLGIGHRLFLVVFETDMEAVWKLPSKNRNGLYLAGICFDSVILSIALFSQLIFKNEPGVFLGIMKIIVLDTFIRMVYQCCVFMKTDLYYLIENVLGCFNLMESAQQLIKKQLPFKFSQKAEVIFESEKKMVLLYSVFYFIGVFLSVSLYAIFYIPQLLYALKTVLPGLEKPLTSLPFWDAALFSLQILIVFMLLLISWRKKYIRKSHM